MTCGPGTFLDDLIWRAGGFNNVVTRREQRWPMVSAEYVLGAQPEWLLTATACTGGETAASKRDALLQAAGARPRVVHAAGGPARAGWWCWTAMCCCAPARASSMRWSSCAARCTRSCSEPCRLWLFICCWAWRCWRWPRPRCCWGRARSAWRRSPTGWTTTERTILLLLRVPRMLMALLAGVALAISGALMQTFFRNPLAEPYVTGVSAGGALGAVPGVRWAWPDALGMGAAALTGASAITALLYAFALRRARYSAAAGAAAGAGAGHAVRRDRVVHPAAPRAGRARTRPSPGCWAA